MGIIKNSITFGSGFNITAEGPIDSRMIVESISDLNTVWNSDAPAYEGMMVSVLEDGNVYTLIDSDFTDINNWKKQGGGIEIYSSVDELPDGVDIGTITSVLETTAEQFTTTSPNKGLRVVQVEVRDTVHLSMPPNLEFILTNKDGTTIEIRSRGTAPNYTLYFLDSNKNEYTLATYSLQDSTVEQNTENIDALNQLLQSNKYYCRNEYFNQAEYQGINAYLKSIVHEKETTITKVYVKNTEGWKQYSELIDESVTTEKISNGSVTIDKLSPELQTSMSKVSTFLDASAQSDEIIDTLKEIQEYIESDESGAAAMVESIASTKSDVEQLKQSIVVLTEEEYKKLLSDGTINEENIYIVKFE